MESWAVGQRCLSLGEPALGLGTIKKITGRTMEVGFAAAGIQRTYSLQDPPLHRVAFHPGDCLSDRNHHNLQVKEVREQNGILIYLGDQGILPETELSDSISATHPEQVLLAAQLQTPRSYAVRRDAHRIREASLASPLRGMVGARIELVPHQLFIAARVGRRHQPRVLLADEVGLGKTVEACLILSRLLRTGRAERALVIAPATLTVQWLGELWRKFHQVFVLLDAARRADVARELGPGFNPFEAHARLVVPLEDLASDAALARQAAEARLDLVAVDEAHRLERRRGETGSPAYRAVAPVVRQCRHALLLSATPLEADTHGFFRLLELLRPEAHSSEEDFAAALEEGRPLPPCTSATRRVDIGGIPPRVPLPVDLQPADDAFDPRAAWLAREARRWAPGGDDPGKALVFVHELPALQALKARLEAATGRRVAVFHEELPADRRDLEVAEFRRPEGPTLLISTECGGEGRNFEFCRRLVLYDLPRDPAQVEQRIGRLDRVTRRRPIEIVYFRPAGGFEADLVRLYEDIGLLRQPLGGLERTLGRIEAEIRKGERLHAASGRPLPRERLVREIRAAVEARERAVYHHLHQDGYEARLGPGLLQRVPAELDGLNERFVTGACELLGFDTAEKPGARTWYLEFGGGAVVDHLPGVPGGTRFLGTFDRAEAVAREELDFFAAGHPLVEGLLAGLQDGARGRSALLELEGAGESGLGLLLILPDPEQGERLAAVDLDGRARPAWVRAAIERRRALRHVTPSEWQRTLPAGLDWRERVGRLLAPAGAGLRAVAGLRLRP